LFELFFRHNAQTKRLADLPPHLCQRDERRMPARNEFELPGPNLATGDHHAKPTSVSKRQRGTLARRSFRAFFEVLVCWFAHAVVSLCCCGLAQGEYAAGPQ